MRTETITQTDTQGVVSLLLAIGLIEGRHYTFLQNKEKITIKMIGDKVKENIVFLRQYLKDQKIKYESNKVYVYFDVDNNEAVKTLTKKDEVFVPANTTEALLYVLNLHQILFFVKEEKSVQVKIQCIDADEIKKVIEVCNFYHIKFEPVVATFELILFKTFDFERITADKVTSAGITDPKKFRRELIDSIYAVDYELDKQGIVVQKPTERLVKDVTRSTRYTMSYNRKNIDCIKTFSLYMMSVYGVDVLQDEVDQNTFFVIGPKDTEFSNSANESTNRAIRKTKSSIHPVSKLLIDNGIKCYVSTDKQTSSFSLRLDEQKLPKTISFHCIDEKEKQKTISKALLLLKSEGYQVALSQTKQRIVFLSAEESTKGSHPISVLLKKAKFITRKNGKNLVPAFTLRFSKGTKNVTQIPFVGGTEKERNKIVEKARIALEQHGFYFTRKNNTSILIAVSKQNDNQVTASQKITKSIQSNKVAQTQPVPDSFIGSLSESQINLFLQQLPVGYIEQKFKTALDGFVVIREKDAIAMRPDLFVSVDDLLKK